MSAGASTTSLHAMTGSSKALTTAPRTLRPPVQHGQAVTAEQHFHDSRLASAGLAGIDLNVAG